MANGEGSKTAKIVLGIVGGVLLLCILCCVGGYMLVPQEAKGLFGKTVTMARQMTTGVQAFDAGFREEMAPATRWQLGGGGQEAVLLVGVGAETELDDATAADLQDRAWQRYAKAFAEGGMPLTGIGVGRAGAGTAGPQSAQGHVTEWTKHVVDVDTLVERTGVPAPPEIEFFESVEELSRGQDGVDVDTSADGVRIEIDASGGGDGDASGPDDRE